MLLNSKNSRIKLEGINNSFHPPKKPPASPKIHIAKYVASCSQRLKYREIPRHKHSEMTIASFVKEIQGLEIPRNSLKCDEMEF